MHPKDDLSLNYDFRGQMRLCLWMDLEHEFNHEDGCWYCYGYD